MKASALVKEKEFQTQVVSLANLFGWWVHHEFDSRRSTEGWPDLVLIRPPRLIFAELKTDVGKTTAEQDAVIDMLRECGETVHVWRPRDWEIIQRVLQPSSNNAKG